LNSQPPKTPHRFTQSPTLSRVTSSSQYTQSPILLHSADSQSATFIPTSPTLTHVTSPSYSSPVTPIIPSQDNIHQKDSSLLNGPLEPPAEEILSSPDEEILPHEEPNDLTPVIDGKMVRKPPVLPVKKMILSENFILSPFPTPMVSRNNRKANPETKRRHKSPEPVRKRAGTRNRMSRMCKLQNRASKSKCENTTL